jgi:hypothetical protein
MTTFEQSFRPVAPAAAPAIGQKATSRLGQWMDRILREPLVHFFLAGLVLFIAADTYQRANNIYRIEITPERVATLELSYQQQFGAPPTPAAREALIGRYIDEEVLFREGLAVFRHGILTPLPG